MEQYLNLVWKNYTASLSQDSDVNPFDENDDNSDVFVSNDLHYNVPFWVGVTVITLLCFAAIIATIRYCIYSLCSSSSETEKLALMAPRSPNLSASVPTTSQRRRREIPDAISHQLSDETELSSSSPEQSRDQRSDRSIIHIIRPQARSPFSSTRRQQAQIALDNANSHYSPSNYIVASRTPHDFRRNVHDIYVLPVSPALSSSSSTAHTDEMRKGSSSTMPVRSRRHLPSAQAAADHNESSYYGVKNACFADSPQLKNRTLPRSHNGTLRRVQAPAQPPPLPPTLLPLQFTENHHPSPHPRRSPSGDLDSDVIAFPFSSSQETLAHRAVPPPVPSRSQKPAAAVLPIGLEEIAQQCDANDVQQTVASSPQDDHSEHAWPNPPESMSTSQISGPSAIPYDHLLPTIIMQPNSTINLYPHYQYNKHLALTESET